MKNVILLKKILFVAIPALAAVILFFVNINKGMVLTASAIGIMVFFKLYHEDNSVFSPAVRAGWALIIFSVFMGIMSVSHNLWALIAASLACIIIYMFSSLLTEKFGLEDFADNGTNNVSFLTLFFIFFVVFNYTTPKYEEYSEQMEAEYARSEFEKIGKIEKETYGGNTYFMVTTEKGEIIGVDARKYPEIRHAAKGDEIKYTLDRTQKNGLNKVYKLMIR